jgi:hypothetical protein
MLIGKCTHLSYKECRKNLTLTKYYCNIQIHLYPTIIVGIYSGCCIDSWYRI